jgi:hypothetical protein
LSKAISAEYKLLSYLGEQYVPPDKIDARLNFNSENLVANPNLKLYGDPDSVYLQIKALLMRHRFDQNTKIYLMKSINIVHDFHVQQANGDVPQHISFLTNYSLLIIVVGTMERNEALAPCLAQVINNRMEAKKPTWVYIPPMATGMDGTIITQEKSPDVAQILNEFDSVVLGSNKSTGQKPVRTESADFSVSSK